MNQSIQRALFFILAAMLLIAACAPAPAPTQDPAEIEKQIADAVALTVAAQNAEQAQQVVTEPTNTPLPTQTETVPPTSTPLIPTATPFVLVPSPVPASGGSGGGGGTVVQPEYACDIIRQRPIDDTVFKPGDTFDINWTIVNTGTKAWVKGLDVKYNAGPEMAATNPIELPAMKPGDQYQIILDATAPAEEGRQVMVWMIEGGFCYPYVRIVVEK